MSAGSAGRHRAGRSTRPETGQLKGMRRDHADAFGVGPVSGWMAGFHGRGNLLASPGKSRRRGLARRSQPGRRHSVVRDQGSRRAGVRRRSSHQPVQARTGPGPPLANGAQSIGRSRDANRQGSARTTCITYANSRRAPDEGSPWIANREVGLNSPGVQSEQAAVEKWNSRGGFSASRKAYGCQPMVLVVSKHAASPDRVPRGRRLHG